jgi:hypothetical protein
MNYFIKREEKEYGPYSLADLQKYVASGNILLTDLCRSEGLTDWIPVSQVIGNIPVPSVPAPVQQQQPVAGTVYGSPTGYGVSAANLAAPVVSQYPPPPNLHWGAVLALTIVTCWLFGWVWLFIQAAWAKKVNANSKALIYFSVAAAIYLVVIATSVGVGMASVGDPGLASYMPLIRILNIGAWVLMFVGCFNLKSTIEEHYNTAEPIGLTLSGAITFVMAFFGLGQVYFQYHFTKINEMKRRQAGQL